MAAPNRGLELIASSVRSCLAPASGSSSGLAFGVLVCSFNRKVAKTLGLTIAPEGLYQANRLIHWEDGLRRWDKVWYHAVLVHQRGVKAEAYYVKERGDGEANTLDQQLILVGVLLVSLLGGLRETTALEVGETAPDFTLPSTMGGQISLSQFQGKQFVLIEFYGADFSPVWVANLSARKADYSTFQALNVQLLAISTNHTFSQTMFAESLQLPYPLLSDFPDLRVTRQYGGLSLNATLAQVGIAERAFFLIDKEGIVRQRWLIKGGEEVVFPSEPLLKAVREVVEKP